MLSVLFIGDIVGKPGRSVLEKHLRPLVKQLNCDCVIANIENSAGGFGFTKQTYHFFKALGIHGFTLGNHAFAKRDTLGYLDQLDDIVRPLNFTKHAPGKGYCVLQCGDVKIGVINAIGRVFMQPADCPFEAVSRAYEALRSITPIILLDFHTEATSEIGAMGWFMDGKLSAVFGTHTHVMTADNRVLPNGTAFISDVGMVGSENSVLGMVKEPIVHQFVTQLPIRKEPSTLPPFILNGIHMMIHPETGKAVSIERIYERVWDVG